MKNIKTGSKTKFSFYFFIIIYYYYYDLFTAAENTGAYIL